jgi:tripartite-type tricarboxylate transporter receptor subunit TctC
VTTRAANSPGVRSMAVALLVLAGLLVPDRLPAQSPAAGFPGGKPITLIVPYAAGGTTDSGARLLAARLEEILATRVQVVNRPGAASQVGLSSLLASPPNGYTLSYGVLPTVITHYSDPERQAPYARKDFRPVAHHHLIPAMIAVPTGSPHTTLREFVEAARANPGKITISDSALMGNPHLTVLMLQKAAGVKFASVHFDGGAPSVTALLGGHVQAVAGGISDAVPHVKAGKFRVLGIAAERESEFLPGVPTMKAQGYDVVSVSATGLLAPAATSPEIVEVLTAAVRKVVESEDHRKRLQALGVSPHYLGPDDYGAFWASYEARVAPLVKELRAAQ